MPIKKEIFMRKMAFAILILFLGAAEIGRACDSEFCQEPRPKCDSSWCDPAEQCQPEAVALKAALGVLMADGHAEPLTHELYPSSSQQGSYGVVLSYSGIQYSYAVSVDRLSCQVTRVELRK